MMTLPRLVLAGALFLGACQPGMADDVRVEGHLVEDSLTSTVRDLEARGGTGTWFESVMPDRLGGQRGKVYLVKSIPARPSSTAKFLLLRTEETRAALEAIVVAQRTPVVLGQIPAETQVEAAAIQGLPLAEDTLRVAEVTDRHAIILVKEDVSLFALAHENRHWLDYEAPSFTSGLETEFREFAATHGLGNEIVNPLLQVTLEIRGHGAQARAAREASANGWPYINRIGTVVTGPRTQLDASYRVEQSVARQNYEVAYNPVMMAVRSRLSAEQAADLAGVLHEYDFSDDPGNTLTFHKVFGL